MQPTVEFFRVNGKEWCPCPPPSLKKKKNSSACCDGLLKSVIVIACHLKKISFRHVRSDPSHGFTSFLSLYKSDLFLMLYANVEVVYVLGIK